jgi:hypothetical protein
MVTAKFWKYLALLGSLSPVRASTVVVNRTPKQIVIAADSLMTGMGKKVQVCKIGTSRRSRITFAVTGYMIKFKDEAGTVFSAYAFAEDAISHAGSVSDAASRFERKAMSPFLTAVRRTKKEYPKDYKWLERYPNGLQVVFAAFEDGAPVFAVSSFIVRDEGGRISASAVRQVCPGAACPSGNGGAVMGVDPDSAKKRLEDAAFWKGLDEVAGVRKLVEFEIAKHPDVVGPPISILTIDKNGRHWKAKGECK